MRREPWEPRRRARWWNVGDRVRIDAPGYSFNRKTATVVTWGSGSVQILIDGDPLRKAECLVASEELIRMRDQTPNPLHIPPPGAGACWWRDFESDAA